MDYVTPEIHHLDDVPPRTKVTHIPFIRCGIYLKDIHWAARQIVDSQMRNSCWLGKLNPIGDGHREQARLLQLRKLHQARFAGDPHATAENFPIRRGSEWPLSFNPSKRI